jgi:hypothetical protein
MDISDKKSQKIEIVLTLYGDILYDISQMVDHKGIDYDAVKRAAHEVLDESLTDTDLTAILRLEGSLNGKFPGVQTRLKNLLKVQVKKRILNGRSL